MNDRRALTSVIALVLAMGTFQAQARGPGGVASPEVEHIEVDALQQHLLLTGKFFIANGTAVSLGHHHLAVTESSQTRVVAKLPPNLRPATYRVLVSASHPHVNAASLYIQIPQKPASWVAAATHEPPLK